jgi:Na(+)/H(+) antiporter subunit
MIIAITIGVLTAGGVFLVLQRGMVRLILGMTLIGHATNLTLLAAGIGAWRSEPIMSGTNSQDAADPLPQAFVLTAIVISMATTAFMLALAALGCSDDTLSDPVKEFPDLFAAFKDSVWSTEEESMPAKKKAAQDQAKGSQDEQDTPTDDAYVLPDHVTHEVTALQTMGRSARRISTDSNQYQRRQQREEGIE